MSNHSQGMTPEQNEFFKDELFSLTLMATVQRGNVYKLHSGKKTKSSARQFEKAKRTFREALREQLTILAQNYRTPVTDADHEKNIQHLCDVLTKHYRAVLKGGALRFGTAQKALNLYLKYLWCLGEIKAPPHCPFDAEIIGKVRSYAGPTWTNLERVEDYRDLVKAATPADGSSLADWELRVYNIMRRTKRGAARVGS